MGGRTGENQIFAESAEFSLICLEEEAAAVGSYARARLGRRA